jgi:hypothetical protein
VSSGDLHVDSAAAIGQLPDELKWIGVALARLVRGDATDLSPYLHCVESKLPMAEGNGVIHCHVIALDGNGRVRIKDLMHHLAFSLLDYAIPRSKVAEAFESQRATGSSAKVLRLAREAHSLFTDLAKTGEGGELLLFLLAEQILKLPQLLCKMDLKTSGNVHFHGSDGLHAGVGTDGKLALYWAESKVYQTFSSAIAACFESLSGLLNSPEATDSRDLQLLSRYMDLNNPELEHALKGILDPSQGAFNLVEYRGLCLVGFDANHYPTEPNVLTLADLALLVKNEVTGWASKALAALKEAGISSYVVHVFCLPVPSAEEFRKEFLLALGITNDST